MPTMAQRHHEETSAAYDEEAYEAHIPYPDPAEPQAYDEEAYEVHIPHPGSAEPQAYDEGSYDVYAHVPYQHPTASQAPKQSHGHSSSISNKNVGDGAGKAFRRRRSGHVQDSMLDLREGESAKSFYSQSSNIVREGSQASNKSSLFAHATGRWPGPSSQQANNSPVSMTNKSATHLSKETEHGSSYLYAIPTSTTSHTKTGELTLLPGLGSGSSGLRSASRFGLAGLDNIEASTLHEDHELVDLDDDLHDLDADDEKRVGTRKRTQAGVSLRGVINLGTLTLLTLALIMLVAVYPIAHVFTSRHDHRWMGGSGPGGTNGSGQISSIPGVRTSLIDPDTPKSAYTRESGNGRGTMNLVFSDEFNTPGRTFYPGDDPFWEAVDLHYWATNNYEWYDPAAVTTVNGHLRISLTQHPQNNLNFRGGMIQTWNKFCFTGGVLVARVRLPGKATVPGLWPAVWMMGNLGRAGYGATLQGTWPYSYDACDVGTMANQTDPESLHSPNTRKLGDCIFNMQYNTKSLSFLPGQRLSACTCPGDDHPGPQLPNGSYAGRMAPEIDLFEAQVSEKKEMTVSQSTQYAPFNAYYRPMAKPELLHRHTIVNMYTGEITQQSVSGVTPTQQDAVQYLADGSPGHFSHYAVEYQPGHSGYVQWWSSGKPAWRLTSRQLAPDPKAKISARPVPPEPMYIIANLGISENFGQPAWNELMWPSSMDIDWIRVYQSGTPNIGCDPPAYPTAAYIARHAEAYNNPNLTLWGAGEGGYEHDWPRNRLYPGGCDVPPSKDPGSPTHPIPKAKAYHKNLGNNKHCKIDSWNKGQIGAD